MKLKIKLPVWKILAPCSGLVLPLLFACNSPSTASASTEVSAKFEQFYTSWHRESDAISTSSDTHDYISLPSYRRIVELGKPALPLLEQKLKEDKGGDFMLAYAVVEICGWNPQEFMADSGQAFRDRVLQKLETTNAH